MANNINLEKTERLYQIDYKENLAVAMKMMAEIEMDLESNEEILNDLRQVDLMEQDVLHMIEFYNFNASEGYNFAKMLKDIREERRIIKDRLEERKRMRQFLKDSYKKSFKTHLGNVLKFFEGLDNKQESRTYRLRVLNELEGYNKIIREKKNA